MFDGNIFYHEYIILANTMKFNIFYKEFANDLYSYDYKYQFNDYNELLERLKNTKKINAKSSFNKSFYDKEAINKFLKPKNLAFDDINLSKPKNIKYSYNLVILNYWKRSTTSSYFKSVNI